MPLFPWESYQLRSELDRDELLRLLQRATPACARFPDPGNPTYFCGFVDGARGAISLWRNCQARGRSMTPVLQAYVRPSKQGSIIDVSVRASTWLWIFLVPLFSLSMIFILLGIGGWVFQQGLDTKEALLLLIFPVLFLAMTSWLWLPILLVTYISMAQYRREFSRLLGSIAVRTPDGSFTLDVPPTVHEVAKQQQTRQQVAHWRLLLIAGVIAFFGIGLILMGAKGLATGELTIHQRHRHPDQHFVGVAALALSQSYMALGTGLIAAATAMWLLIRQGWFGSKGKPATRRAWPLSVVALIAVSIACIVLGLVLGVRVQ